MDLRRHHLAAAADVADLSDEQVELVGRSLLDDRDLELVAPDAWVRGRDRDGVLRRRTPGQVEVGGGRVAGVDPDDPGDLPAVQVVLADRVAGLAPWVEAAEGALEIAEAGDADRLVGRPAREHVDERRLRGADPDDRADAARQLLDVDAGVGVRSRHSRSSYAASRDSQSATWSLAVRSQLCSWQ